MIMRLDRLALKDVKDAAGLPKEPTGEVAN